MSRLPLVIIAFALALGGLFTRWAGAAPPTSESPRVTVAVVKQPLPNVLEQIFRSAQRHWRLEPQQLQVPVTARFKNEPLESALEQVLAQVTTPKLTYRVERGVYRIFPQPPPAPSVSGEPGGKVAANGFSPADPSVPGTTVPDVAAAGGRMPDAAPTKPALQVETGHSQRITGVSFSHDGRYLATGGAENNTLVWDVASGKLFRSLKGHFSPGGFRPDGKSLLLGDDKAVVQWSVETGRALRIWRPHTGTVHSANFSDNGRIVVTSSPDHTVCVLDGADGRRIRVLKAPSLPFVPKDATPIPLERLRNLPKDSPQADVWYDTIVAPGGGYAAGRVMSRPAAELKNPKIEALYQSVAVWDLSTGEVHYLLQPERPAGLAFAPDGKTVAVVTENFTVSLWNVATGQQVGTLASRRNPASIAETLGIAFRPDGRELATAGPDRTIEFWDLSGSRAPINRPGHNSQSNWSVSALTYSQDGKLLASGSDAWQDHPDKLRLWDVATHQPVKNLGTGALSVNEVAAAKDGLLLAASSGSIRLWDSGMRVAPRLIRGEAPFAVTTDNEWLACRTNAHQVSLFDLATLQPIRTFESGPKDWVTDVAFSPDGALLATINGAETSVRLWDLRASSRFQSLAGFKEVPLHTVFSPNGVWLAVIGGRKDPTVHLFNLRTGQLAKTYTATADYPAGAVAFSPDSGLMAIQQDEVTGLVDLTGMQPSDPFQPKGADDKPLKGVDPCFTPDGRYLITEWDNGTLTVRNTSDGGLVQRVGKDHHQIRFSPDGKWMVSRSGDGLSLQMRDTHTGKQFRLPAFTARIASYAFSGDGSTLITSGEDATVRIWNPRVGRQLGQFIGLDTGQSGGDYVASTPDGYYMASKAALVSLSFRLGDAVYPFDQFDLQLNRPDLVLKSLGLAPSEQIQVYARAYEKRVAKMKLDTSGDPGEFHLPEVSIVEGELPKSTDQRELRCTVLAYDPRYHLRSVLVYINDVPIHGSGGIDFRKRGLSGAECDLHLVLTDRRNKIQISAVNEKGLESRRLTYEVLYTGVPAVPNLYVLAVGVSNYRDSNLRLDYAAKDATDLAAYLSTQGRDSHDQSPRGVPPVATTNSGAQSSSIAAGRSTPAVIRPSTFKTSRASARGRLAARPRTRRPAPSRPVRRVLAGGYRPPQPAKRAFDQVFTLRLLDEDATIQNLRKARSFLEQAREEDHVIVYFAGHGLCGPGYRYFFLPYEGDPDHVETTGLAYEDLENLVDGIRARKKLLLLDSCHSGEADETVAPAPAPVKAGDKQPDAAAEFTVGLKGRTVKTRGFKGLKARGKPSAEVAAARQVLEDTFADLRRGSGAMVVAAAGSEERAFEGQEFSNGVFTFALLQGLRTGKADANHDGVVTVNELREYVINAVQAMTKRDQRPTARRESIEFDWAVR